MHNGLIMGCIVISFIKFTRTNGLTLEVIYPFADTHNQLSCCRFSISAIDAIDAIVYIYSMYLHNNEIVYPDDCCLYKVIYSMWLRFRFCLLCIPIASH